jgi:hypothetical protein
MILVLVKVRSDGSTIRSGCQTGAEADERRTLRDSTAKAYGFYGVSF